MKSSRSSSCWRLAACAPGEPLPPIQGPWISLNPDHWQPSEAEQQAIKALPER